MNLAGQDKTTTLIPDPLLTVWDLQDLADAATRMGWSLACLIGAMESSEPIAWMAEKEPHGKGH